MPLLQIKKKGFLIRSKIFVNAFRELPIRPDFVSVVLTNQNSSALSSAVPEIISKHGSSSNIDSSRYPYRQQKHHTLTNSQCCATTEFLHRLLQQKFSNSKTHHAPLAIHVHMWAGIFQSVVTHYWLGGKRMESRWGVDFLQPS